ncbi:MAG TPA: hypothetical protein VF129_12045 [Actinomycetota bacterium]
MPEWAWILIVVAIVGLVAAVAWFLWSRQRTQDLRRRFGPEYDRTVRERGDRSGAEHELIERREHRESLDIRSLSAGARRRYAERWEQTQATFVDSPALAVTEADVLVQQVLRDRGYPMDDPDLQMADVSVDHPDVMDRVRAAGRIAGEAREGRASTEDLRRAMVHYRELFQRLLATEDQERRRRTA